MKNKNTIGNDGSSARGRYLNTAKRFKEEMSLLGNPLKGDRKYSDYQYSAVPSQELEPEQEIFTDEVKEPGLSNESRVSSVTDKPAISTDTPTIEDITDTEDNNVSNHDDKKNGLFDIIGRFFNSDIKKNYQAAPTLTMGRPKKDSKGIVAAIGEVAASGGINSADGTFALLNGIIDTRIGSKEGDLLRNNIGLQEKLDFVANTVNKAREAKEYEAQLNEVENDPEAFNRVHNAYTKARLEYFDMKKTSDQYLQEMHDSGKDINGFSEISKIKNSKDLEELINKKTESNLKEIEEKTQDIVEEKGAKKYINRIYEISPEYREKQETTKFAWTEPSTWYYTVPQTLGSSFGFMEATAAATAASFAGNFLLKQLPKLGVTGGASLLSGLIVSTAASAGNIWANIVARQQESNAEVYDYYKEKLYAKADEKGLDINKLIVDNADKLMEIAGIDITVKTPDEALDDMIIYNIRTDNEDFEAIKRDARKNIDKLYDQNMALSVSDVGQSLLVIPGAGKLFGKVMTLNGKVTLGKDLSKFGDKVLNNTTREIAANMAKIKSVPVVGKVAKHITQAGLKRFVNKGLTPLVKLGMSAVAEMNEEGTQYIAGSKYLTDYYDGEKSSLLRSLVSNTDATIDAFSGILGISSDPALNNDEDLAQNMKLGAVVSLLMGGGSQTLMPGEHNTFKRYLDDLKGSNIAKKMVAEHVKAKEDMEMIKQYAAAGLNNSSKREGYISQLESMKSNLPPAIDANDIDTEIVRAKKVFSLLEDPLFNATAADLKIKQGTDDYNNLVALTVRSDENAKLARDMYNKEKAEYDKIWATTDVSEAFNDRNVPEEQRAAYLQYIKLNTERRAIEDFINDIVKLSEVNGALKKKYGFAYNSQRSDEYIAEAMAMRTATNKKIEELEHTFKKEFGTEFVYDRIDENDLDYNANSKYPSVLLNAIRSKELSAYSAAFKGFASTIMFGGNKISKMNAINTVLKNYKDVQADNEAINEALFTPEEETIVEEVKDSELGLDANTGKRRYEERVKNDRKKKKPTLADKMRENKKKARKEVSETVEGDKKTTIEKPVYEKNATEEIKTEDTVDQEEKTEIEEKTETEKMVEKAVSPEAMGGVSVTSSVKVDAPEKESVKEDKKEVVEEKKESVETKEPVKTKESLDKQKEEKPKLDPFDSAPSGMAEKEIIPPEAPPITAESIFDAIPSYEESYEEIPFDPSNIVYEEEPTLIQDEDSKESSVVDTTTESAKKEEVVKDEVPPVDDSVATEAETSQNEGAVEEPEESVKITSHEELRKEDVKSIEEKEDVKPTETKEDKPTTEEVTSKEAVKEESTEDVDTTDPFDAAPSGIVEGMDVIVPAVDTEKSNPEEPLKLTDTQSKLQIVLFNNDSLPTDEGTLVGTIVKDRSADFGLTSGTVYFSGNAMFPGHENAEAFNEFLSQPDALEGADVQIVVGDPGAKYNENFVPSDRSTWGNAAIYVVINKGGKTYSGALKTVLGAEYVYKNNGKELDQSDIDRLVEFRNQILEAYLANPTATIRPNIVRRSNGLFNVNRDKDNKAVNRPITQIKGFNIPKDIRELDGSGIVFGIGRGAKNNFFIVDHTGHTVPGFGNSGKVHIYPRKSDTPSQYWSPPIKLNELRFADKPDLVDLLYEVFVEQGNSTAQYKLKVGNKFVDADFTNNDVVRLLINEGEQTLVKKGDSEQFGYLTSKQFYYNFSNDMYIIGDNIWSRKYLLTSQGKQEFQKYVMENLHVNTSEEDMHNKLQYEFYTTLYKNKELKELKLSESLVFTKNDFDTKFDTRTEELQTFGKSRDGIDSLTHLQWMVKNGWLRSDLKDQLFTSPFLYVSGVNVESSEQSHEAAAKELADSTNPIKGENNVFLEDRELMDELGLDLRVSKEVAISTATEENTRKAKQWLMKKLGLTEDQVLVGDAFVRAAANGTVVMGTTYKDSIALAAASVPGTGYHEAFHRVSTLILSKAQQDKLYEEYRRRNPEYAKASDLEVEEALAEDFRAFMLKREKPIYSILKWFNPIVTFIRKMFKPDSMLTVYNMLANGDFSKYKMNPERYAEFENAYKEGLNFTIGEGEHEYSPKAFTSLFDYYNSTIPSLAATLLIKSKAFLIQDVNKVDTSLLRKDLQKKLEATTNANHKASLQEILDNFDTVFMPDVMRELERLSIRAVEKDKEKDFEDKDSVNKSTIQNYDKASYEVSKKDNALAGAKMFIATIPKVNFSYTEVDGATVRSVVPELDPVTGMLRFIDFDTSWNLVLNNLYNVETWQDMIDATAKLSDQSTFFYQLNKRLSRLKDVNLQTQLLQTVKSNKHNMFAVKYGTKSVNGKKDVQIYWTVDDSGSEKAALSYPVAWSQTFYNSDLVSIRENGSSVNSTAIESIKNNWEAFRDNITTSNKNMTEAEVDIAIGKIVSLLNRVGITIDKETVESALTDVRVSSGNDSRASALFKIVTDARKGSLGYIFTNNLPELSEGPKEHKTTKGINVRTLSNVYEGLGKNSIIGILAKHYANIHPNPEEIMVLGANNNLLYPISQNCYMSDQVRWLNQKGEALDQLSQVTYSKGSLILNALKKNHDIKLNTFVNFKSDMGVDKGRDYMGISPIEDYLSKMTLTANNHIILPTMADKKMYFTISGARLFNKPLRIIETQTGSVLSFDQDVITQFQKVGLDELNTIIEFYNNKEKVEANKDLAVKNYHTNGLGGRFRHFTHITKSVNGKTELISLNKILDDSEAAGTIMQTLETLRTKLFSETSDSKYVHDIINGMLKYLMATEVVTAEKLGIIKRVNGVIYNNVDKKNKRSASGLDQVKLEEFEEQYAKSPNSKAYAHHYAALSMIANYAINSALSVIEIEKVFTGDSAFYNPSRSNKFDTSDDKIKRLSEVLSTGDNLRTDWPAGHRLEGRTQFTAAEIKDNEIASHQFDELKELFTQSYARKFIKDIYHVDESELYDALTDPDSRTTYEEAWKEADKVASISVEAYGFNTKKGKGNINQADASVYISPQMYKDMMEMLGEWSPEIEKAFDIMESDKDWLSDPELYHDSLKTLIKPLKMMYYGQHFIPELNIQVPIFDKMAMFPMFKILATGDNRALYERMTGTGAYEGSGKIDMVAFGSAIKVGSRSPGTFYTDSSNREISDLSKWSVFSQDFKYLRRQLITDPHTAERQMLGTQAAKGALSNLVMDREYGVGKDGEVMTGQQIRDTVFDCMKELSNLGRERILKEIGTDGKIDNKKLSEFLIRSAKSKGMGADIINGLQVNGDVFNISLSALSDSKWLESTMVGLTNREAIDIVMPGGAYIQMSSFGLSSIKAVSDRAFNNGQKLSANNKDGSMDAMVSINLFSHIIPHYNKLSYTEAKQWLIDNNVIGNKDSVSPVAMGYRIPTQGLSSISALRIVDVFPSNIGDTIVLPDHFTALTGSDFDIDKLYVARFNYEMYEDTDGTIGKNGLLKSVKKSRKVEYKSELGAKGNSREALENRLLEMYMKVLTDKSNAHETKLPLDNTTNIVKDEILPVVDGPAYTKGEFAFKYVSPTFQLNKKYEYSGGKNGIAPFALNNVHHVLTQLMGFSYKYSKVLNMLNFGDLSGIDSKAETVKRRGQYGEILKDGEHYVDKGERILDWLSAMINAHVDVAKDPYVIRLNVVQWTYNMANFLLRSGYGRSTFFFLPQPILKDMAAEIQKLDGKYGVDPTKTRTELEKDIANSIVESYAREASKLITNPQDAVELKNVQDANLADPENSFSIQYIMERDFLIDQLQKSRSDKKDAQYYIDQIKIYKVYELLTPYAKELSELVHLSQVDTKKIGNNFNLQRRFLYRLKDFIINNRVFDREELAEFFRNTFLDVKLKNSAIFNNELFKGLTITSSEQFIEKIENALLWMNLTKTKDDTVLKIVSNELEASIKAEFFNKYIADNNIDVKGMYYGENNMAARLSRLKNDIMMNKYSDMVTPDGVIKNELLTYLSSEFKQVSEIYDSPNIITVPRTKSNDKYLETRLIKYWEELLESSHPEIQQFAKDLVVYAFMSSGDNYNKNSFFNLVPNSYRKSMGYSDAIQDSVDKLNTNSFESSTDGLFVNTWYNDNIVRVTRLKGDDRGLVAASTINGNKYPVLFTKPSIKGSTFSDPIGRNKLGQPVFKPYLKMNLDDTNDPSTTVLYKYIGYYFDTELNDNVPVYAAVNKKGMYLNGKVVREFNDSSESILPFNNLPYKLEDGNLFETVNTVNKDGKIVTSYKNIKPSNAKETKEWIKRMSDLQIVTDYVVEDIVGDSEYEDIINGVFPTVEKEDSNEKVKQTEKGTIETTGIQEGTHDVNISDNLVKKTGDSDSNRFTFKDGVTIKTPFVLNSQQENALNELANFLKNPSMYNNEITLTGYAGTGKTTIIGLFDKYISETYPAYPKYTALTHRANSVTKMNNPSATVYTLNQLFGISAEIDLTDPSLDMRKIVNAQAYKPKIEYGDLVIVDEASMVSKSFYDFIEAAKNKYGIKVIYVGDPAQLAPPGDNNEPSPVFSGKKGKIIGLTKVERTGDNPILEEATALREGGDLSYTSKVNSNGEGVIYTKDDVEAFRYMNELFTSEQFAENKLFARVLSAVNDQISIINNSVRRAIFGQNPDQLEVGDILIGYDNVSSGRKDDPGIINSGDYEVMSVKPYKAQIKISTNGDHNRTRGITIDAYKVVLSNIMDRDAETSIVIASNNVPISVASEITKELELLYRARRAAWQSRDHVSYSEIGELISNIKNSFITMKEYSENGRVKVKKTLDYGYAHTIHKSQGGTYNNVIIYEDTIDRFRSTDTKRQLKYVAVSRAKEKVLIVTNKQIRNSDVNSTVKLKPTTNKISRSSKNYSRSLATSTPRTLYIFTDNTDRTSGGAPIPNGWYRDKYGEGGYGSNNNPTTAVIRGLNNAAPVSTMRYFYRNHPNMSVNGARWTDADIDVFKSTMDDEFQKIKEMWDSGEFDNIVVPSGDGFFNSKIANISKERTPQLYKYLYDKLIELNTYVNSSKPVDKFAQLKEEENGTPAQQWSSKEGWSEEYYNYKVLPKLSKAWQVEFELAPDQKVKADFRGKMSYDYGTNKRADIKSSSTIEAIVNGERTATTRYDSDGHMDYWKKVKVGDIIEYSRDGHNSVKVVVTKPFTKLQKVDAIQQELFSTANQPVTNKYSVPTLKIISGGQTGVDRIGLEAGKALGIETGGTATPGYVTEKGRDTELAEFGVTEISKELQGGKSGKEFYLPRTEQNVINSDGTVYFATNADSAGKIATERFAKTHGKPFLLNPTSDKLNKWLNDNNIQTLNVAGNRGSRLTGEQASNIGNIIKNAFSTPVQQEVSNTSNPFDDAPSFSDEVVVDGNSIQTLVTVNDNGLKETTISTRRAELEEIIKQRTDIDANAFRSEFDATVEAFKDADSDSLNNALIKLLCKY